MNKFKKIFMIISAVIFVTVSSFLIAVQNIKSNVCISIGTPYLAVIFDHDSVGNPVFDNINSERDEQREKEFISSLYSITNVSVFDKLINGVNLDKKIYADDGDNYATWSINLKTNNIVVELYYNSMQDLVVYQGNDTRVISYYCLAFLIPDTENFTDIVVYYSFTNSNDEEKDEYYRNCSPLILHGEAKTFAKYIEKIKES